MSQHPSRKSRGQLNLSIARVHEWATQLIALQLAASNLLALFISMLSIVAGTVTYAVISLPGAWLFWIVAALIGCVLALLIEGMTLGALIRIRLANKQIRAIVGKLEGEREQLEASGQKVKRFWRRKRYATRTYRRSRRSSVPLAIVGAAASATGGGLFYHQVVQRLGFYESIGISALFALIVTGTFVSSELYKDQQEEAVREGFRGGSLAEEALREETYRQTNQAVAREVSVYLESQKARDVIQEAASQVLGDVLAELRTRSAERVSQAGRVGRVTVTPADSEDKEDKGGSGQPAAPDRREDTALLPSATMSSPSEPVDQREDSSQNLAVTPVPDTANMTDLSPIEQAMLEVLRTATQEQQDEALALAVTVPLPELIMTLQARYPTLASTLTVDRMARVLAAFQQDRDRPHQALPASASSQAGQPDTMDGHTAAMTRPSATPSANHQITDLPLADPPSGSGQIQESQSDTRSFAEQMAGYRAGHPAATQADMARAFGMSDRTLRRKLAVLRKMAPESELAEESVNSMRTPLETDHTGSHRIVHNGALINEGKNTSE